MILGYQAYSTIVFLFASTCLGTTLLLPSSFSSAFQPQPLAHNHSQKQGIRSVAIRQPPPLSSSSSLSRVRLLTFLQSSTVSQVEVDEEAVVSSSSLATLLDDETTEGITTSSSTTRVIQTLNSLSDFLNYIDNAPYNSLAVVEFYGINCPMCKRVSLKYKKIAKTYSQYGVLFAEMDNHPANKHIMDVLGIHKFPFLHVYRNGQCVASHGTESSSTFEAIVKDTIQRELDMTDNDWEQFLSAFAYHIQQGTDKINQLRHELLIMTQQEQEVEQTAAGLTTITTL